MFRMTPEERRLRDEAIERDAALANESERPLVAEINKAGWEIDSIWDLVNFHANHGALGALLMDHLSKDYHPKIKMAIARALITGKIRSEACSKALVAELQSSLLKSGGQWEGVQQSLAHALVKLAHRSATREIEIITAQCKGTFLSKDLDAALLRSKSYNP